MITKEMAALEIKEWLKETKRLRPSQIESEDLSAAIEYVVDAMSDGVITIDEDGFLIQKLSKETIGLKELKYKPVLTAGEFATADKYKTNEGTKKTVCLIARATENMEAEINKLENPDYNLAKIITLFYSV